MLKVLHQSQNVDCKLTIKGLEEMLKIHISKYNCEVHPFPPRLKKSYFESFPN